MGLFEYACPKGHVGEIMVPLAERPTKIPCGHGDCNEEATFVMSATPTTFRANDRKAFKRSGH